MSIEYPNPCCKCGFCCLSEICPVAIQAGTPQQSPCPHLRFEDDNAICRIAEELADFLLPEALNELMGFGKGCCIKARAYKDGIEYDFASLPPDVKRTVTKGMRGI